MSNINDDIGKISKKLMFKEAFYGLFLISLNKEVSDKIQTAGVSKNGINFQLTINPEYWKSLSDNHKIGLLKHELLHIAFQHLFLRESFSDFELFNIAADIEVNQYLQSDILHQDWVSINHFTDLNLPPRAGTRVYYDLLNKAKKNDNQNLLDLLSQLQGNPMHHSNHITWQEFQGMGQAEKDLVKRQMDYQMKEIYEAVKSRGTIPSELEDYIKNLFIQKKEVFNWKAYLRRYISGSNKFYTKKTRRKLNKRFLGNPAIRIKPKSRILIGIDTSGSVSNQELVDFFSEIYHIWKTGCMVDIVECDAKLHPVYEYKGKFLGKVHGRGGTDFQPVIDFYDENRKKYSTLIYFTDGECTPPTKPRNSMLWVISSNISAYGKSQYDSLPYHKFIIPAS